MKRLLLAVFLVVGCGGTTAPPATNRITGSMTLVGDAWRVDGQNCGANPGYDDIAAGTQVVVKDQAAVVVATGALGTPVKGDECVFPFTVSVPDGPFYSIEISHRGAITYSKSDLSAKGWTVDLTLGS